MVAFSDRDLDFRLQASNLTTGPVMEARASMASLGREVKTLSATAGTEARSGGLGGFVSTLKENFGRSSLLFNVSKIFAGGGAIIGLKYAASEFIGLSKALYEGYASMTGIANEAERAAKAAEGMKAWADAVKETSKQRIELVKDNAPDDFTRRRIDARIKERGTNTRADELQQQSKELFGPGSTNPEAHQASKRLEEEALKMRFQGHQIMLKELEKIRNDEFRAFNEAALKESDEDQKRADRKIELARKTAEEQSQIYIDAMKDADQQRKEMQQRADDAFKQRQRAFDVVGDFADAFRSDNGRTVHRSSGFAAVSNAMFSGVAEQSNRHYTEDPLFNTAKQSLKEQQRTAAAVEKLVVLLGYGVAI